LQSRTRAIADLQIQGERSANGLFHPKKFGFSNQ
jgi:hypothetical protein